MTRGFSTVLKTEWTLFRREPVGLSWGAAIPIVALIAVGLLPGTGQAISYYHGQSVLQHYLPIIVLVSLAMLGLNALPPVLAGYRERGVLRRLAVTPMAPSRLLTAVGLIHAGVAIGTTIVLLVAARVGFGVALPSRFGLWLLAFLLTGATVLALGTLVSALSPSAKVANGVGGAMFFPLMFLAGLWTPVDSFAPVFRHISQLSPLGASARMLSAAGQGYFGGWMAALALLGYAVLLPVLAVRFFRWE